MFSVYILYSIKDSKLYVGCAKEINARIKKHFAGEVRSIKYRRPLELIHIEEFKDKKDAFARERFLKSLRGGREKRKILKRYLGQL